MLKIMMILGVISLAVIPTIPALGQEQMNVIDSLIDECYRFIDSCSK